VINPVINPPGNAPKDTDGFPQFPEFGSKPGRPDWTFLVAYIAFHEHQKGEKVSASRRDIQQRFRRGNGSGVSKMLRRLVKDGFLEVEHPELATHAYLYGLPAAMPVEEKEQWIELGELLFSPKGLLGRFRTHPSLKHGHIMPNGFLVLAILLECGSQSALEMKKAMKHIMHRNTTQGRLDFLTENDIVQLEDGQYSPTEDWEQAIIRYERANSLETFDIELKRRIAAERCRYYEALAGGADLVALKKFLRTGSCIECGEKPAGQVEHFPPKLWLGFDHPDLMHSACPGDNEDWGSIVKSLRRPNFDKPIVMSLPIETDIKRFAATLMASVHRIFLEGARTGDMGLLELSVSRMESAWPLWYWSHITEEQSQRIHPADYVRPAKPVVLTDWSIVEGIAKSVESSRKLKRDRGRRG